LPACATSTTARRGADAATRLWQQLDGFDTRYKPAYYEDTDLAFRVRAHGLRVLVQPASRVIHDEGTSNGTDTGSG
jgi:GT2 family glycosyltransferase